MYVVVQHRIKDPQTAFARGEKLIKNEEAPEGVRGLQFLPEPGWLPRDVPLGGSVGGGGPGVRRLDPWRLQREHVLRGRRGAGVFPAAVGAS